MSLKGDLYVAGDRSKWTGVCEIADDAAHEFIHHFYWPIRSTEIRILTEPLSRLIKQCHWKLYIQKSVPELCVLEGL